MLTVRCHPEQGGRGLGGGIQGNSLEEEELSLEAHLSEKESGGRWVWVNHADRRGSLGTGAAWWPTQGRDVGACLPLRSMEAVKVSRMNGTAQAEMQRNNKPK